MKRGLQPHLVRDDWLGLDLLHSDRLVEERALVQGELLVGVKGWADLEGGRGRGTNAGQHLRLAECLRQRVARGVSCVALQVGEREGPRAQVGRRRLGGRWHTVQGRVGWHHVWRRLARLGTFCLHGIIICLEGWEESEISVSTLLSFSFSHSFHRAMGGFVCCKWSR